MLKASLITSPLHLGYFKRMLSFLSDSGHWSRVGSFLASLLPGVFIFTICMGLVSAQTSTPPRSATQIWIESLFAIPITERVDLVILGGLHFGRKAERPVVEHTSMGIGASFRLNKHLTIFP